MREVKKLYTVAYTVGHETYTIEEIEVVDELDGCYAVKIVPDDPFLSIVRKQSTLGMSETKVLALKFAREKIMTTIETLQELQAQMALEIERYCQQRMSH